MGTAGASGWEVGSGLFLLLDILDSDTEMLQILSSNSKNKTASQAHSHLSDIKSSFLTWWLWGPRTKQLATTFCKCWFHIIMKTTVMDECQELENKFSGQQSNLTSMSSSHINVYCSVIWSIWSWPAWSMLILQSQKCSTVNASGSWLNTWWEITCLVACINQKQFSTGKLYCVALSAMTFKIITSWARFSWKSLMLLKGMHQTVTWL